MSSEPVTINSPDTWSEQDWLDFEWFGVCGCRRLRREHAVVVDDDGAVVDVIARCDGGHEINLTDIL